MCEQKRGSREERGLRGGQDWARTELRLNRERRGARIGGSSLSGGSGRQRLGAAGSVAR